MSDEQLVASYISKIPSKSSPKIIAAIAQESWTHIPPEAYQAWMSLGSAFAGARAAWDGPETDGRLEAAFDCFQRASRARPASPDPWVEAGRTYVFMGRSGESLGSFARALEVKPDHMLGLIFSANAWGRVGRPVRALTFCDQLIKLFGRDPLVIRLRADLLDRVGQQQEALETLEWSTDENDHSTLKLKARLLESVGRFAEALPLRQRLCGGSPWSWTDYAHTLSQLGRSEEALGAIAEAETRASTKTEVLPHRLAVLRKAERNAEADALGSKAASRIWRALDKGKLPGSWEDAIYLLDALGHFEEALGLIDKVLEWVRLAARDSALLGQRAYLLLKLSGGSRERTLEAAQWFTKAASIGLEDSLRVSFWDPCIGRASLWNEAGLALWTAGDLSGARAAFEAGQQALEMQEVYACFDTLRENAAACLGESSKPHLSHIDSRAFRDPLLVCS